MLENGVIQITTGKLVGAVIIPNSILLISGIIIWRLLRNKQAQLQAETADLNDEIKTIKEQMVSVQTTKNKNQLNSVSTSSPDECLDSKQIGLFEFLIEDNIQLRKHT